jgi:hypothetical protein
MHDFTRSRLQQLRAGQARFSVASLAGLLALASAAQAQDSRDSRHPAEREGLPADGGRRPSPFLVFDTDRDGVVSATEIRAASEVIRRFDRDGDGKLTGEELHPRPPRRDPESDESMDGTMPPPPSARR